MIFSDSEQVCTCSTSRRKAHKIDCPLNSRNLYPKKELFPKRKERATNKTTFELGEYCAVHRARMSTKHLTCRVVQVYKNRYRLYCKTGALSEKFSFNEMTPTPSARLHDIPLDRWRQSAMISIKNVHEKYLDECLCETQRSDYLCVEDDSQPGVQLSKKWITNLLYSLTNSDREKIKNPNGWLTDSVITASQLLLLQHFPHMHGLQPPTLQQVRVSHLIPNRLFK